MLPNGDAMLMTRIIGTGSSLPNKILTNAELERMVDTNDDWITSRTGIKQRRIAVEGEFTSTFAIDASRRAMEMAGISAEELDLIILGTVTPDFPLPSTACIIQHEIGGQAGGGGRQIEHHPAIRLGLAQPVEHGAGRG